MRMSLLPTTLLLISLGLFMIAPGCDTSSGGGEGSTTGETGAEETGAEETGTEETVDCEATCAFTGGCMTELGESAWTTGELDQCVEDCTDDVDGMAHIVSQCQFDSEGSCMAFMNCMRVAIRTQEGNPEEPSDLPEDG